ncbi:MAG TPA: 5'-nucleotidase C-terminal domain-containing protein [Nocardioidaceae bacterium]|nr:5'-nucleotidase C-terminal domain-containing protein [Nocardioidaceae bacterium]
MTVSRRNTMRGLAVTAGLALAAGPLTLLPSTAQAAAPVLVNLLGINDFHGRIDSNTTKFATTVEQQRVAAGEASTLFLSAGDNIGASLFASASANDNPTIDVLNALDLNGTAVGNHEFDKGFADLTGHVADRAAYDILGANVYDKGTTDPALPEYALYDVNGVSVGVIGVVTDETPSLVSPLGIADLDFGDPVEAINRVADDLTDGIGDQAELIVATLHEGAGMTTAGGTIEEEVAASPTFASIVNDTTAKVDAIFTGHTHKEYVFHGPVPGASEGCTVGTAGCTRPIVQTGEYGNNVGRIQLMVDPDNGTVASYTATTIDRVATADLTLPRVAEVNTIVTDALATAAVIGNKPVGEISESITTAYAGGHFNADGIWTQPNPADPKAGRDDRANESTLGDTVADALHTSLDKPEFGNADLGVVNPGGLRDELLYKGTGGTNLDGTVTYAEANAVLPFVNNVWTVTVSGAELKQVLEQQWQPQGAQRPFLQLGLSRNVHVLLDPTRAEGDRVVSVQINGEKLDPAAEYTVATFSFLATGGDNFTAFKQGVTADTGLVDRDVWVDYLGKQSPVVPDFTRRQVYSDDAPATVAASDEVSFSLNKLSLTSLGTPETKTVAVYLRPDAGGQAVKVGEYAVTGGSSAVAFTAPADLPGPSSVVVVPKSSFKVASTIGANLVAGTVTAGSTEAQVDVTVTPTVATGTVEAYLGNTLVGSAPLASGAAQVELAPFASAGSKHVELRYTGDATTKASSTSVTVEVARAAPALGAIVSPRPVRLSTRAKLTISVTAPGLTPDGQVVVRSGSKIVGIATITDGLGSVTLPRFRMTGLKRVMLRYLGDASTLPVSKTIVFRVRR